MDDRPLSGLGFDVEELLTKLGLPTAGVSITLAQVLPPHTPVPKAYAYEVIALGMGILLIALLTVLSALGVEFSGGRCRAQNATDGERCSKSRPPGEDLCQLHDRHHGVTIHPSVRDESVHPEESGEGVETEMTEKSILNDR